ASLEPRGDHAWCAPELADTADAQSRHPGYLRHFAIAGARASLPAGIDRGWRARGSCLCRACRAVPMDQSAARDRGCALAEVRGRGGLAAAAIAAPGQSRAGASAGALTGGDRDLSRGVW